MELPARQIVIIEDNELHVIYELTIGDVLIFLALMLLISFLVIKSIIKRLWSSE